ncbi:MAG: hypothetical protein EZS28_019334 [Streblomastix strix]|uniref:TmcB/TmcC TPR repeats domain-containing protein n=1 Tax=Streblomastix strix TaxID=222440 RepID=A0A5J4VRH9_9EUKA|nr:MAG: hypothetical protein EZS28_019334 [Streblomastix strix]
MSYLVCGTGQYLKVKALQIGGAVGGMCVCVIFLMMQIPLNLFLFDNSYKRRGHFSTYSGSSSGIEYIILLRVVFAQRELVNLYFWRGLVTIGTVRLIMEIAYTKQGEAGSDIIIRCRMLRFSIALRNVLASEVVDYQREIIFSNKLKATVLLRTLTGVEQRRLDNGEDNLEEGVFDMRMFCQGLVRPQAELQELQIHVEHIGDLTSKIQDTYMQLMETCVNNGRLLRSYSILSGQLVRDESEGLICKERDQAIEHNRSRVCHQY